MKNKQSELSNIMDNDQIFLFDTVTSLCMGSVYTIDFKKQRFSNVSRHKLFPCGYSPEEVMEMGYSFYSKIIHLDDLPLFDNMHHIIDSYITGQEEKVNHFSFTARIKNHPQRNESDYLNVYHKLVPIFVDGELRSGVCMMSLSTVCGSKNLRAYFDRNSYFDEYSFKNGKWKRHENKCLTKWEEEIMKLSIQGLSNKEIAIELEVSYDALRHSIKNILKTLGVRSMKEAIVYAVSHLILFDAASHEYNDNSDNPQLPQKRKNKKKKQRRKLTGEKLQNIQIRLNNGESVNSIATVENISRSSIRYALDSGKLTKPNDKKT
jgi:DNA-binding CsgD family transcriptional regulator